MLHTIKIPSLGEGDSKAGVIVDIPFSVGDKVQAGNTLLEVETDKVTVEIPAELSGILEVILLNVGDQIQPGLKFAQLSVDDACVEKKSAPVLQNMPAQIEQEKTAKNNSRLVDTVNAGFTTDKITSPETLIRANPNARRLAREIGIDLSAVKGSGKHQRITKEDIKHHTKQLNQTSREETTSRRTDFFTLPDFSEFGLCRRESLSHIANTTSHNMSHAWSRIPHAWLQEKVDMTELEAWRQENKQAVMEQSGTLTITVLLAKAIATALKSFPIMNSSYDETSNEIVYKDYIDIGIAVDTECGLMVPVLRQVDRKGIEELSRELQSLAERTRAGKLSAKEMQGAGTTISNLGGIGLSNIFPIVNWPQASIIGAAASAIEPRFYQGKFIPRQILTLTLGFDHRIINGADGARYLVHIKDVLEDIRMMLL